MSTVEFADLIPHQDWCHAVSHAACCGTGEESFDCDCGAYDQREAVAAYVATERVKATAQGLRTAAVAALEMHDPPAPDCVEWAAWLAARAAAQDPT